MRKHRRRGPGSDKRITMPTLRRHKPDNVVTVEVCIDQSDNTAAREGDAIIRRGQYGKSDKAFHDSILWNMNVRKKWVRRMLELSDEQKVLGIYLQNVKR